jgi:transposase
MEYIKGTPRDQLYLFNECIDNLVEKNNPVRIIDAYVESLDLESLEFIIPELKTGKPPYRSELLLKVYIYGYNERTRSSRRLEKECQRNKEMIWLTEGLAPDFKTIADFRKKNKKAIRNVFKEFLMFCKQADLLSLETVGIDGTKMRAQNNQNNIYRREEIETVQKRIQEKIEEYLSILDKEDEKEGEDIKINKNEVEKVVSRLKKLKKHKNKINEIKNLFEEDKDLNTYFSTDNDARFQNDNGKIRAGYNSQIVSDDKNKLIIENDVTNESNDLKQMSPMIMKIEEIKEDLGIESKTKAIMDAGYDSEQEILKNKDNKGIDIIVSDKKESSKNKDYKKKKERVPGEGFKVENFIYNSEKDIFICSEGKELKKTHKKASKEKSGREVFEYQCYDCDGCKSISFCTNNKRGRSIKVSVNKEVIDIFKKRIQEAENKELLSRRKEIVEHPFGTIKRNLGFTYFMQKGLEKVKTEFSFICFTYNFKRVVNILGVEGFLKEIERQKQIKLA